jgi:hypothetical protein
MRSVLGKAVRKRLTRRLAGIAPELVERPAAEMRGTNGRLYAWRAGDALTCFLELQISERDDAFTFNIAWGPSATFPLGGPITSLDQAAPTDESAKGRIGFLRPDRHDVWWALHAPPEITDGDFLERSMNPPAVGELVPKVDSLVEKAIVRIVEDVLPLFARVAKAQGLAAPARWEAPPPSVSVTEAETPHARETAVVANLADLPRVTVPAGFDGTLDVLLGPCQVHLQALCARLGPSPMREVLEAVVPRFRELVAAGSAVLVPQLRALDAALTPAQRRTVAGYAPARPFDEPHFDDRASREDLERRAVYWARLAASRLRSAPEVTGAARGALVELVAAAEAYLRAIESVAPPRAARPGLVLP